MRSLWRVLTAPFRLLWRILHAPVKGARRIFHFLTDAPEDRPVTDALADVTARPRLLLEQLEVLRRHLLRSILFLALMIAVSFIFTERIVAYLAGPVGGLEVLQAIDITETVGVFMRVSMLAGFTLATPYIAFELWLFVAPALYPRTRILGLLSIPLVTALFVGGMVFAYFVLLPPALEFLLNFLGIAIVPRPSSYVGFVTGILFWVGVSFQFPLIVYVLTAMRLVRPQALLRHWRIAVVLIAVLAAAITPTVDPVNMALVMAPMILLYFIGVGLSFLAAARRRDRRVVQE